MTSRYWYYRDEDGDTIGPSPGGHLHYWIKEGHINQDTMISTNQTLWLSWQKIHDKVADWSPDDEDLSDESKNDKPKLVSTKRVSIIEMQAEDDGGTYYYDDPDLGGTGKTSW